MTHALAPLAVAVLVIALVLLALGQVFAAAWDGFTSATTELSTPPTVCTPEGACILDESEPFAVSRPVLPGELAAS